MRKESAACTLCVLVAVAVVVPCTALADPAMWQEPAAGPGRGPTADVGVEWTIAVFVSGDNNLERYWAEQSRPALERLPANPGLRIVAVVDWLAENGTHVFEISGGVTTQVAAYDEMNFGDGATFQWFLTETSTLYPSEKLAVVGWDHGYAWRYFSDDQTSGDRITMPELQSAIEGAGVFIDVLAFDACNMAAVEVAYQVSLTGLVGLLVGSEESIPLNGFPYDLMLTPVAEDPTRTAGQLAADMVTGWGEFYGPQNWAKTNALSATDVGALAAQTETVAAWCSEMHENLGEYEKEYKSALSEAIGAWATTKHVDLVDLGLKLLERESIEDEALREATEAMVSGVGPCVVAMWNADEVAAFNGLTLWWGLGGDWTWSSEAYLEVAFASDMGWWDFLSDYNG